MQQNKRVVPGMVCIDTVIHKHVNIQISLAKKYRKVSLSFFFYSDSIYTSLMIGANTTGDGDKLLPGAQALKLQKTPFTWLA